MDQMTTMADERKINPWWWVLLAIMLLSFAARQAKAQTNGDETGLNYPSPKLHLQKNAKKPSNWNYLVGGGLIFASGMADGVSETLKHHYPLFEQKFQDADPLFWSNNESWKNKWQLDGEGNPIPNPNQSMFAPAYVERYWGSSRWFVALTDAPHLFRSIDRGLVISGATIIQLGNKDKPVWQYVVEVVGAIVIRSVGFSIVHDFYFKK